MARNTNDPEEYRVNFFSGQIQYTSIGTKFPTRTSKSNIPFPPTPFSATVGDEGNGAIIGFNQDLIQFSSYFNQSFIFARGYSPDAQDTPLRPFLAQAQNDDHRNNCGWGLHVQESIGPRTKQFTRTAVERGFIDDRWPTQTDVIDGIIKKGITYIDNGRLIQAVAIGNLAIPNRTVEWTLGGLVQLGERTSQFFNNYGVDHFIQTSPDGYVLSVTTSNLNYCLDIQLFNNGLPIPLVSGQQRSDETATFVDIRLKGSAELKDGKPRIFLAAFTFRDLRQSQGPTNFRCPKWDRIRNRMMRDRLQPPIEKQLFPGMRDITTRNVMQLLYTGALPSRPPPIYGFVECSPESIDYAATFWHIRLFRIFLSRNRDTTLTVSKKISEEISKAMRVLFAKDNDSLDCTEKAYRTLTLYYALRDKNDLWSRESILETLGDRFRSEDAYKELMLKLQPCKSDMEANDPITSLLLYCNYWVAPPNNQKLPKDPDMPILDRLWRTALDTSILEPGFQEELWNQLALLAIELLGKTDYAEKLVILVASQLKKQQYRISSKDRLLWGYSCLNHSQRIELAIAQSVISESDIVLETLQDPYLDCLYFLRSDHSFLRCLDTGDRDWLSNQWNLECSSIICSSFLSIGVSDRSIIITDSAKSHSTQGWTSANVEEVLEILRDIAKPNRHENPVPWHENVRVGYPYYPPFMQVSCATREATRDRVRLTEKLKTLSGPNKTTHISNLLGNLDTNFPSEWSLDHLIFSYEQMAICDFGHNPSRPSVEITPELLAENRIKGHAAYRMLIVDTFTDKVTPTVDHTLTDKVTLTVNSKLLHVYLHFAHPDAWDIVVDFYGSMPVFRGSPQSREISAVAEEKTWNTSISLPYFSLEEPNKIDSLGDFPQGCFSICITGDKLGEFWTCSILGKKSTPHLDGTNTSTLILDINNKVGMTIPILENAEHDKYSARNLIFILHLADISQNIVDHYENCLSKLEKIIDIKEGKKLSRDIASKGLTGNDEEMARVTDALNKALWGVEWLENFDRTLQLTKTEIQKAVTYVEEALSKRRSYWPKNFAESEEIVWTKYTVSFEKIQAFKNRIGSIIHEANGVKDNLILLSNMNSIKATLKTTKATLETVKTALKTAEDTSSMKMLTGLTTIFLPFTFFAVLFTTPMFKWPDAPDSSTIVKLPFILWCVLSSIAVGVLSIPFYYTTWRTRKPKNAGDQKV